MPILAIMTAMTDNNDDSHADVFYDSDGDDDNHEHADDNDDEGSLVCHLRGVAEFVIVNILPLVTNYPSHLKAIGKPAPVMQFS